MSGSELDVLICEGRTLAAHVCDSNVQLERMLRRAHRIAERVRVMREHQRSLDEIFAETSDGIRRRQLLDELQKENRDRMRCIEENSILRENLSEGFMAFEQIFLRNRKMEERMATDGKIRSQINAYSMSVPDEAEEWRRGQEEANVREALRKFVLRAEQVMRDGEAESSSLAEFAAQVHVHNLGIKDLLSVHQRMHFSKLYRSGLDMLRCELNEQQEIVGSANSADLVDDSEHVNREITTVFNKKLFDLAPTTTDADGESEDEDGNLNGTVIEVPLEDD